MKKIKSILLVCLCLCTLFLLTGCDNKTAISADDFREYAEDNNLTVSSILDNYTEDDNITTADFAVSSDDTWGISFYVLTDTVSATTMYEANKTVFENSKESSSVHSEVNVSNYSTYSLDSGGYYMYLCRIDNTLLYVKVMDSYKDEVTAVIDELGY